MATIPEIAVFVFCLIGCGITSYRLGRQAGMEDTVQHFIDAGVLEVSDDE